MKRGGMNGKRLASRLVRVVPGADQGARQACEAWRHTGATNAQSRRTQAHVRTMFNGPREDFRGSLTISGSGFDNVTASATRILFQ